jgi:ribulose-5-phosphate 4-epimerase/fuculose-1-phosphate aldolase
VLLLFQLIKKVFQRFTIWLQLLEEKTLNVLNTLHLEQKNYLETLLKLFKNRSACLIANHGQVAFSENLEQAFELAQRIENICHQYINALRIGIPKILSKKEMKIVLGKFKNYKKG